MGGSGGVGVCKHLHHACLRAARRRCACELGGGRSEHLDEQLHLLGGGVQLAPLLEVAHEQAERRAHERLVLVQRQVDQHLQVEGSV